MSAGASTARRFLTASQAKRLYARHIAMASPTQPCMLDSAIGSPVNHAHYGQTDLFQLAGVVAEKMILNHAFQNGNKRASLYAADMFLKMNGHQLQGKATAKDDAELDDGLANAHVLVATRRWTSEELGRYYASIAGPSEDVGREVGGCVD